MNTGTSETTAGPLDAATAATFLSLPWPSVRALHGEELSAHAQRWAERFNLVPTKLRAVDVGRLTALTYPGASVTVQRILVEFFAWVFLQDDFFDEVDGAHDTERLERTLWTYLGVLEGVQPSPAVPAPLAALGDVRAKLRDLGAASWFARFASSMRRFWFDGVLEESRHRACGITPSLARYHAVRMESVCVYPVLDLIEAVYEIPLPPAALDDPLVNDLRRLATAAIAAANDVFSYEKERRAGDPHNLVYLLTVTAEAHRATA